MAFIKGATLTDYDVNEGKGEEREKNLADKFFEASFYGEQYLHTRMNMSNMIFQGLRECLQQCL